MQRDSKNVNYKTLNLIKSSKGFEKAGEDGFNKIAEVKFENQRVINIEPIKKRRRLEVNQINDEKQIVEVKIEEKIIPIKKRKIKKQKKTKFPFFTLVFAFFFVFLISWFLYPFVSILQSYFPIRGIVSEIKLSYEKADLVKLDEDIERLKTEFSILDEKLDQISYVEFIPYLSDYTENINISQNILKRLNIFLDDHYGKLRDIIEQVYKNKESEFTIADYVDELPKYLSFYLQMKEDVKNLVQLVDDINFDVLPFLNKEDRGKIQTFKSIASNFENISGNIEDVLKILPNLIGQNSKTTYLIILQNEAEMRSSGGLLTAYGTMTFDKGEIVGDINLTDTWILENYVSADLGVDVGYRNIYGQLSLMLKGCGATYARAQDVGMYPDLYWSSQAFADYYDVASKANPNLFPKYDHVVILNFAFAEDLLETVQPLEVEGFGTVSASTLFDFIKKDTDDPKLSYSSERKRILAEIANALKLKFFNLESSQILDIANNMIDSFARKNIALSSNNVQVQRFFDNYNLSGRIDKSFKGDYIHINEAQNCSLKLNKFIRNSVIQNISISDEGGIFKDVNIKWENPQVYDESLKLQYDNTGIFTYRAWIRLFAPLNVESFDSDGLESSGFITYTPIEYTDKVVNKYISDNIIRFDHRREYSSDPIPGQELNIAYSLPDGYFLNNSYNLLVQKHPGKSWGEEHKVNINYKKKVYSVDFILDEDKVLNFDGNDIVVTNYYKSLDWAKNLIKLLDN